MIEAGGMVIDMAGDGPAVLLLHGLGGTSNSWQAVMPALSGCRTIRPDFPGAGRSATPEGAIDVAFLVRRLEKALADLDLTEAVVIGHSFGTLVAQHLAARRPALAKALVLFGPIVEPADAARERLRARAAAAREQGMEAIADQLAQGSLAAGAAERDGAAVAFVRESHMRQEAEGFARSCEALAGAHRADPGALTMPVFIATGDEDGVAPPSAAQGLADDIAGARVEILAGCGHWAPIERPGACRRIIAEALSGA